MMPLVRLILGAVLLAMGRRLYWFFLGTAGFFFGFDLARRVAPNLPHGTALIIAIVIGIAGAVIAIALQKFAIFAGGFLVGGYLAENALRYVFAANHLWLVFIIGGIIGAILMNYMFTFALIVLSSLMGAMLILQAAHYWHNAVSLPLVLLAALGIAIQYGFVKPGRSMFGKKS
ncbi:MAG: DUF4203 domain-containing protein [Nitrospiraceae bacterium]|nr:DUF4203 domain-containing protein [Nitrospiraceae bacterium]